MSIFRMNCNHSCLDPSKSWKGALTEWFGLYHHIENEIPFSMNWCFWRELFSSCKQIWFCFSVWCVTASNFIGKKILWESLGILVIWKSNMLLVTTGWLAMSHSQAPGLRRVHWYNRPFLLVLEMQLMGTQYLVRFSLGSHCLCLGWRWRGLHAFQDFLF